MSEIDDIKKLPLNERVKKLKELEAKHKTEIEQAQKAIEESKKEEAIAEELKDIPIPQMKAIDIESLFTPEEKQMFGSKRYAQEKQPEESPRPVSLERSVAESAPQIAAEAQRAGGPNYAREMERLSSMVTENAGEIYQRIKGFESEVESGRRLSQNELTSMYAYQNLLEQVAGGNMYIKDQETREMLMNANQVIEKTKSYMRGGV